MEGECYAVFGVRRNKQGIAEGLEFETMRKTKPEPGYFKGERVVLKITGFVPMRAFLGQFTQPPAFWGEYVKP